MMPDSQSDSQLNSQLNSQPDYSNALRSLMQPAGISSFRALAQAAGLSRWQVDQLRRGQVRQLRVEIALKLAQTLQVSLEQLLELAAPNLEPSPEPSKILASPSATAAQLRQEYQRLQLQLDQQRQSLQQEFQQNSLQALESWLTYYPAAAQKAAADPNWPAVKLLPLIRPLEALLKTWNVEMLAPVGAVLPYDPQQHLLIAGSADPGEAVTVRHPGYRHGERLLYRAKVSRVVLND